MKNNSITIICDFGPARQANRQLYQKRLTKRHVEVRKCPFYTTKKILPPF